MADNDEQVSPPIHPFIRLYLHSFDDDDDDDDNPAPFPLLGCVAASSPPFLATSVLPHLI
jgi:hypothetical protein